MGRRNSKGLRKKLVMKAEIIHIFHSRCFPDLPLLQVSMKEIHSEIKEALQIFYEDYLEIFRQRKLLILSQGQPLEKRVFPSVSKKEELMDKLSNLIYTESFLSLYYIYSNKVQEFMHEIHSEISQVKTDYLKLVCLSEAFSLSLESSSLLAEIYEDVFKDPPIITCQYITKLEFFECVLKPFEHVLKDFKLESLASELFDLYNELNVPNSNNFDDADIDEIVDYIEGKEKKQRKPYAKEKCEEQPDSVDIEVEELKERLNCEKPSERLKPKLSEYWVNNLRKLISK